MHSFITLPRKSVLVIICASMYGSSILAILVISGSPDRVVDFEHVALRRGDAVRNVGYGGDHVHVELTVQALLYYLHVKQPEESAAESETEGKRTLRLERQRCVVQLQFFERCAQVLVLVGLDRVDTREDHRLDIFESGYRLAAWCCDRRNGITYLYVRRNLYTRTYIPHITCPQFIARLHLELEHAYFVGIVLAARIEELDVFALADTAVEYAVICDDAAEWVEDGVENQRLQRGVVIALRCRYALHDGLEYPPRLP